MRRKGFVSTKKSVLSLKWVLDIQWQIWKFRIQRNRCRDIKWELLRRQVIFTPPIRLNGVSHRVSVGKEEKSETLALGLSNRLKGKGKTSQRSIKNEGRWKIKRDWCLENQVKKWVGDRVNDQLSWELKSLDLAIG